MQSSAKEMKLSGETALGGEQRGQEIDKFKKALKNSQEFKIFTPPDGSMEFNLEGESGSQSGLTLFTIQCASRRAY
jgi:hypothetical protein